MQRSSERILTSHVGSLPRSQEDEAASACDSGVVTMTLKASDTRWRLLAPVEKWSLRPGS